MGLTPQVTGDNHIHDISGIPSRLGFDRMTSSWSFILVYFLTLNSLGALIIRRLVPFQKKDYAFYLNHIGLWLLFFASGLGAADMERYVMKVNEGQSEWRSYDKHNNIVPLDIAIELNDFYMEEYPPSLAIIDRNNGEVQPGNKPEFFQLNVKRTEGRLAGWDTRLEEYIQEAISNSERK